jgi:predicted nucleic acid-binding protein
VSLVIDAAPLIALADRADPRREAVRALLHEEEGDLVVPAQVTAEVDYLLGSRHGSPARLAFLDDLAAGRFAVACLEFGDYATVAELERSYHDLDLGLADCSIVVLAQRFATRRLATFDERRFRTVTPLQGGTFEILPTPR